MGNDWSSARSCSQNVAQDIANELLKVNLRAVPVYQ